MRLTAHTTITTNSEYLMLPLSHSLFLKLLNQELVILMLFSVPLGGPLHDHYATTYGVHRDSILNESRYFHVTEGLVPDDVLEGALEFEVKQLLKLYTNKKIVSLYPKQRY